MIEIELKSRELKEFLYIKLGKRENEPLYDVDLDEITELDLNCIDLLGEKSDATIEDIVFFKNLKSLYLSNFILDDQSIKLLNLKKSLEFIQINDCIFKNDQTLLALNVKHMAIIDSENIDFSKIKASDSIEMIHIVHCSNVNFDGISGFNNLKKVYIQNMFIDDISDVVRIKSLVYLNINGSKVETKGFDIKNYDFVIENDVINTVFNSES